MEQELSAGKAFMALMADDAALRDPAKAAALRPKAVDLFNQCHRLGIEWSYYKELSTPAASRHLSGSFAEQIDTTLTMRLRPYLLACGDPESADVIGRLAKSADPAKAEMGRLAQVAAQWIVAPDAAARGQALDQYCAIVKELDPRDTHHQLPWALGLPTATAQEAAARRDKIIATFPDTMLVASLKRQLQGDDPVKAYAGKPVTFEGKTVQGQAFTTAQWKGKVVLVDFWATWCAPCKAALPHVKGLYKKYHADGLEVLGVSSDYTKKLLVDFLAADPDMPWPNLFDQSAADNDEWHPMAVKHAVSSIPRVFLIGRDGVCRTVEATELDTLIPKLLAEPAASTAG